MIITADSATYTADSTAVTSDGYLQALGALAGKLAMRVVSVVRSMVNVTTLRGLSITQSDS